MSDKPIPAWAVKAAEEAFSCYQQADGYWCSGALGHDHRDDTLKYARLLVSTREAALREAAPYAGSYVDSRDILDLIPCEPGTGHCASCGCGVWAWRGGEGHRLTHIETCPHYIAPPPPPPEIPWVRIT